MQSPLNIKIAHPVDNSDTPKSLLWIADTESQSLKPNEDQGVQGRSPCRQKSTVTRSLLQSNNNYGGNNHYKRVHCFDRCSFLTITKESAFAKLFVGPRVG